MRVMFEPWFVKYKVDVVFAGHVHAYERSVSANTWLVKLLDTSIPHLKFLHHMKTTIPNHVSFGLYSNFER